MFRVFAAAMLVLISIIAPPMMILTIPLGVLWLLHVLERRAEAHRVLAIYHRDREERELIKTLNRL